MTEPDEDDRNQQDQNQGYCTEHKIRFYQGCESMFQTHKAISLV